MPKALPRNQPLTRAVESTPGPAAQLSRDAWIALARRQLIETGLEGLKVDRLAKIMGVTRGSFYWHFKDRDDLLDALLASWRDANTAPFEAVLSSHADRPERKLLEFFRIWLDPARFDAAFDGAVREWARSSKTAERMLQVADKLRMDSLRQIFAAMGYDDLESEVRARIVYYHQVGYYALQVDEPMQQRLRLFPFYYRVLAGVPVPRIAGPEDMDGFCTD